MIRLLSFVLLAAPITLGVSGCDEVRPSEGPLPSFEELREEFAGQPLGHGLVQEDDDPPYETHAVHHTTGEGELARFRINLTTKEEQAGMTLYLDGIEGADLQPGMQFETLQVIYGVRCAAVGSGRLEVTSVADSLIAGVFAADVTTRTLTPCELRLQGGFSAVFDPPEE